MILLLAARIIERRPPRHQRAFLNTAVSFSGGWAAPHPLEWPQPQQRRRQRIGGRRDRTHKWERIANAGRPGADHGPQPASSQGPEGVRSGGAAAQLYRRRAGTEHHAQRGQPADPCAGGLHRAAIVRARGARGGPVARCPGVFLRGPGQPGAHRPGHRPPETPAAGAAAAPMRHALAGHEAADPRAGGFPAPVSRDRCRGLDPGPAIHRSRRRRPRPHHPAWPHAKARPRLPALPGRQLCAGGFAALHRPAPPAPAGRLRRASAAQGQRLPGPLDPVVRPGGRGGAFHAARAGLRPSFPVHAGGQQ